MLKNIFFIALLSSFVFASMDSFAQKNHYFTNYEKAKENAKQTNKPLMLVLVTNTCPWCEKLEKQTLSKKEISNVVMQNFTPLILNRDTKLYPSDKFVAKVVPSIFFIDSTNEKIINTSFGYKTKKKFINVLDETILKSKGKS